MLQKLENNEEQKVGLNIPEPKSFITSNLISRTEGMLYGKTGLYIRSRTLK